jgi:hypothetical protein
MMPGGAQFRQQLGDDRRQPPGDHPIEELPGQALADAAPSRGPFGVDDLVGQPVQLGRDGRQVLGRPFGRGIEHRLDVALAVQFPGHPCDLLRITVPAGEIDHVGGAQRTRAAVFARRLNPPHPRRQIGGRSGDRRARLHPALGRDPVEKSLNLVVYHRTTSRGPTPGRPGSYAL